MALAAHTLHTRAFTRRAFRRNRLEAARAEKLVYVFSNLRFLRRAQQVDFEEQCWSWEDEDQPEEAGEASGS
jgi:hypothetical protein